MRKIPRPTARSGQAERHTSVTSPAAIIARFASTSLRAERKAARERLPAAWRTLERRNAQIKLMMSAPKAVKDSGRAAGATGDTSLLQAVESVASPGTMRIPASTRPRAPRRRVPHPSASRMSPLTLASSRKSIESANSETEPMARATANSTTNQARFSAAAHATARRTKSARVELVQIDRDRARIIALSGKQPGRTARIEDEHRAAVIHSVIAVAVGRLAVIGDAVALAERRERIVIPAQSDKFRSKGAHIALQHRESVASRIDGDEQHSHARGLGPEPLHCLAEIGERRRAGIRAMRIAEVQQHDLAAIVLRGDHLAVLIGERE